MKTIKNFKIFAVAAFVISSLQMTFVSCSDDPGSDSYYTTTAEYAADYLRNREQFSSFYRVIERANLTNLLGTYGAYTVFAPTNAAFDEYLASYGYATVDEIPQVDCDTIALNHIIENVAYFTTDVSNDVYNQTNMLDRVMQITSTADTLDDGNVKLAMYINKTSLILVPDDSVENGVVHTMEKIIGTKNAMLNDVISEDSMVSIFYEALKATRMDRQISTFIDESYSVGSDSIDWTNDALVTSTATEYDNVAYPEKRLFKFTAFIEPDSIYEQEFAARGYDPSLPNLEKMKLLAKEIYDPMYPEDASIDDITDRKNSLNRFISYHLLDRIGTYYTLTCVDGQNSTLAKNWKRNKWDIADWYETMMPHSIMKFSFPSGSEAGLYINRRGVQSRPDERGVKIRGAKVFTPNEVKVDQTAVNGVYHYIDRIIHYGEETQKVVLDERLRIDASTLSPDFMNSGARGHYTKSSNENGKYGLWDATSNKNNRNTCLGFKAGFTKNFEFSNDTHIHVRPRVLSFWSYQGDEVTVKGIFNITLKLPPVPAGTYELRLFTCVGFQSRGIVQAYFGQAPEGETPALMPCGIPFDMRPEGTSPMIGNKTDTELGDDDAIAAFDKAFRNRGWMRGPHSYANATSEAGGTASSTSFCNLGRTIRRIITTFYTDGTDNCYLRLQQKMASTNNEMNFDFIELCPSSVYNNSDFPEDRW